MNTENITLIYALRDNGFVRYMGKTCKALEWRLADHLSASRKGEDTHKGRGVRKIISEGRLPTISLLEVAVGHGDKEEMAWIAYFRSYGIILWNETDGGEGIAGFHHDEQTRIKIGVSNAIAHSKPETRKLMCLLQRERMKDPANRARISKALQGHPTTEKVRIANRSKILSVESRRKMGSGMRGKKVPLEVIEKRRKAMIGHPTSVETRRKISDAHKGMHPSDESRMKMRLAKIGKVPWNKGLRSVSNTSRRVA